MPAAARQLSRFLGRSRQAVEVFRLPAGAELPAAGAHNAPPGGAVKICPRATVQGLGLCHGIPGNGYVFLCLHRQTGEALWLRRARHFACFACQRAQDLAPLADRPTSLFEGVAGAALLCAELLPRKQNTQPLPAFPAYEI